MKTISEQGRGIWLAALASFIPLATAAPDETDKMKPLFSCEAGGEKIEVFIQAEPFDPAAHRFESVQKEDGSEEWTMDGEKLSADHLTIEGDGHKIRPGFQPSTLKSVVRKIEVHWNGTPGIVTGAAMPWFNASLDTDFAAERSISFRPATDGKSMLIRSASFQEWIARKDENGKMPVPGNFDEVTVEDKPVLDCTVNGERIEVFFSKKDFDWPAHDTIQTRHWKKGSDAVEMSVTVDGKEPWGIDGEMDALGSEIARFEVRWNGKAVPVPRKFHANCFNPFYLQCRPATDGKAVMLDLSGGDGAGGYGCRWVLRKDGKHVFTGLDSE